MGGHSKGIYPAFLHIEKWDLQAICGCTSPFQGPKAHFRNWSIFIISKMERSLTCSSLREEKSQALLFRGNWWQKFRDMTGPFRLIDGLQFGKGKMAVVEQIKATTWRLTYDEDFRIQAAGKRLHSLRLARVCGGNTRRSRSQTKWHCSRAIACTSVAGLESCLPKTAEKTHS